MRGGIGGGTAGAVPRRLLADRTPGATSRHPADLGRPLRVRGLPSKTGVPKPVPRHWQTLYDEHRPPHVRSDIFIQPRSSPPPGAVRHGEGDREDVRAREGGGHQVCQVCQG